MYRSYLSFRQDNSNKSQRICRQDQTVCPFKLQGVYKNLIITSCFLGLKVLNHTWTWKVLFISRLTHSWCCLLNPGATNAALMYLPLQHMARESCKLHHRESAYLFYPVGSPVSGCCIVNNEHYELFTSHEMTKQCAERADHGSQQEQKRTFWCWHATASIAHS